MFRIPQDPEARSLIVGVAITGDYAITAWSNVLMWPADEAPYCVQPLYCSFPAHVLIRTLYRSIWLGSGACARQYGDHRDRRTEGLRFALFTVRPWLILPEA